MRKIADVAGIVADAKYPKGYKLEGQSTVVSVDLNQDMVQFFRKIMQDGNFTENGLFDNEDNGYQSLTALLAYLRKNCLPDTAQTVGLSRAASSIETEDGTSDILFISPLILKYMSGGYKRKTITSIWNMDTDPYIRVPSTLSGGQRLTITNISVTIIPDGIDVNFPLNRSNYPDGSSGICCGSVTRIGNLGGVEVIELTRTDSQIFDSATYNNATVKITFDYIP